MSNEERKHCIHEVKGDVEDVVFPPKEGEPYKDNSRLCDILRKGTKKQRDEIIKAARKHGINIVDGEIRCPFYNSGTSQADCPYFSK